MSVSFADLGVSKGVVKTLAARGITTPFPIQAAVIADAIAGRDVLGRSETGSGKTLGFAIPLVEQLENHDPKPSALVLCPTRELAVQVSEELKDIASARNLRVALAYGGTSIMRQANNCKKSHIIVATPGRLEDLCQRRLVDLSEVKMLVLDEADHMLDMGFQPQVDRLVARIPSERQTMLFSATLDGEVGRIAKEYTNDPVKHEIETEKRTATSVEHRFIPVAHAYKLEALIDLIDQEIPTLIVVRTKHGADRLSKKLNSRGVDAVAMHGDMNQRQRERALAEFADGYVNTLVATDVAARGIDVEDIERVINFDAPGDDKSFVHRVGRTGRAGRTGESITFVAPDQEREVGRMATRLEIVEAFEREGLKVGARGGNGDRPRGKHARGPQRHRRRNSGRR
ncbi:MAG: DEAD/DEAH box helicase [Actinomycetota bacterium]